MFIQALHVDIAAKQLLVSKTDNCTKQVQSGGSFDIDYKVTGPGDKVILDGTKERQGDFVFTANDVGEYRFCFNNEMSTFAEKLVDFEIAVRTILSLLSSLHLLVLTLFAHPGRERSGPCQDSLQARLVP